MSIHIYIYTHVYHLSTIVFQSTPKVVAGTITIASDPAEE